MHLHDRAGKLASSFIIMISSNIIDNTFINAIVVII